MVHRPFVLVNKGVQAIATNRSPAATTNASDEGTKLIPELVLDAAPVAETEPGAPEDSVTTAVARLTS